MLQKLKETTLGNVKQSGIRIAKERGVKFGRPRLTDFEEYAIAYLNGEMTAKEAIEVSRANRATFFRRIKELREGQKC